MSTALPELGIGTLVGLATEGLLVDEAGELLVEGIDEGTVGDDGGWTIVASGVFPLDVDIVVRVTDGADVDAVCYSGVLGQGNMCRATADGAALSFVVPPLPIGTYTVVLTTADEELSGSLVDGLEVIKRSWTDRLYGLRSYLPPPRDVGPYDLSDEE